MFRSYYIHMLLEENFKHSSLQYTLLEPLSSVVTKIRLTKISPECIDWKEDSDIYCPHITVFYGLSEGDYSCIRDCLEYYGPLHFSLKGQSKVFITSSHNVLVLPIISDDFHRLYKDICQCTGKEPPVYKRYSPHVTICYMKKEFPIHYESFFDGVIDGVATTLSFHDKEGIPRPIVLT